MPDASSFLAWDDAGPVAILVLVVFGLGWLARWLLVQLIRDKSAQIARLELMNDRLATETAATLNQILEAQREARR